MSSYSVAIRWSGFSRLCGIVWVKETRVSLRGVEGWMNGVCEAGGSMWGKGEELEAKQ